MFEKEIERVNSTIEAVPSTFEKRTYTVEEIQNILSIGRSAAYDLVKTGNFRSVRIGGSIRISKKSFDAWLDNEQTE